MKTQLKQAVDRKYCPAGIEAFSLVDEVCAMLYVLRRKILDEDCGS